ncbi:unnamed protein product [Cutaneotrichosporon oleaginosum]
MRLNLAFAWLALSTTAVSAASSVQAALDVLISVAGELQVMREEARHTKRAGIPMDLGPCEPRCVEGDGVWDDCLIFVNFTKCLQHCYQKWSEIADCFHCNQENRRKDHRIWELQLGEACVRFLRDPTADPSWVAGDGQAYGATFTYGQAPTQSAGNNSSLPPIRTITVGNAA